MPHRRHARPMRAAMPSPPSASRFLPPQPLAERRASGGLPALGRRGAMAIGIGLFLALVVPIALSALGPVTASLQPLAGGVAGAVSGSFAPVGPAARPPAVEAFAGSVLRPARTSDPEGPRSAAQRIAPPVASLRGYQWPIPVGRISLPFKAIPGGSRIKDGQLFHDGLDMASFCGAPVGAAHAGVVLAAGRHFDAQIGWIGDLGPYLALLDSRRMWNDLPNVVVIDDGNGYRSLYAHFRDVTVRVGEQVRAGQLIGHEGATGHASGCHVHYGLFSPWETRTFGVRADMLRQLKLPPLEIARIDPLLVLPGGDVALRTLQIAPAIAAATAAGAALPGSPGWIGSIGP